MPTIRNFEDLEIWKTSRIITKQVYTDFKELKDFGFKDQIQRCTVSIMNNIAEGFCRNSLKEKGYFLNIAKGSAGELKSMYYVAEDLNYVSQDIAIPRRESIQGMTNGIGSFMSYLRKS